MLRRVYNHFFNQPNMGRRIPVLLLSVIVMGMCVAFFEKLQVGTDPYNVFNLSIVNCVLHWESLGAWHLIFNAVVVAIIFLLGEQRCIGLGSLANVVLAGFARDCIKPLVEWLLPGDNLSLLVRGGVFIPTMILFLLSVAFYLVVDLGASPYDALPQIIAARTKGPFSIIRIVYDLAFTGAGLLLGGEAGLFTMAACFFLGPVISAIAAKFRPWFG